MHRTPNAYIHSFHLKQYIHGCNFFPMSNARPNTKFKWSSSSLLYSNDSTAIIIFLRRCVPFNVSLTQLSFCPRKLKSYLLNRGIIAYQLLRTEYIRYEEMKFSDMKYCMITCGEKVLQKLSLLWHLYALQKSLLKNLLNSSKKKQQIQRFFEIRKEKCTTLSRSILKIAAAISRKWIETLNCTHLWHIRNGILITNAIWW